jgi:hypothetical protein
VRVSAEDSQGPRVDSPGHGFHHGRVSTRTDLARRLELSQVEEIGTVVTGRARGMAITLEGEPPFTACIVDIGAALPIAQLVMRAGDLNHPDAVETADQLFDEAMQVTALASYAPTIQRLLKEAPVRRAVLEFFKQHPDASLNGSRLRVPAEGGVTQQLIGEALALAQTIAERFAEVGFLESELAPKLPPGPTLLDHTMRIGLTGIAASFAWSGIASFLDLHADRVGVGLGALFVITSVAITYLVPSSDLR